ncbi:AfsR/SARP family transcriptional regulator [Streptomyces virginiae]|uniref:AfsR/SARP family transcriptional regulator n=2 Tax=Streptomyces TaxID=1883 RepID=UPI00342C5DBF
MRISMLGPLDLRGGNGNGAGVGGTRLRALLILLALEPGRVVASELLIDGIWAQDPPAGAANALQALVPRLRRALPGAVVASHPAGYRLAVEPDAVDVVRFERLASEGRQALARDPAAAAVEPPRLRPRPPTCGPDWPVSSDATTTSPKSPPS